MIRFKIINPNDLFELALILSWRSNPTIYKLFFEQSAPLYWEDHLKFWIQKTNREDYFILHFKRPIGHIAISRLDSEFPEISILIGETTLWGKGLASKILSEFINIYSNKGLKNYSAVISKDNLASIKVFEKCGFLREDKPQVNSDWLLYILRI